MALRAAKRPARRRGAPARVSGETRVLDLQFHLQHMAKAYNANKWILEDRTVPISQHLRYFNAVVSSVACVAGRHTIYKEHIQTLDLHFRKFCRSIVGPPPHIDWRFCTLGTNAQHILLASQKYKVGPEVAVVRIGNWPLTLPNFPFINWIQRV